MVWRDSIHKMNFNANTITTHFIDKQIKQQIQSARNKFDEYVNDYLTVIKEQKSTLSTGDQKQIRKSLQELVKSRKNMDQILKTINSLLD
jgi:molecular chaperone DnaK (HSP70)